jgi:hypothetical protein
VAYACDVAALWAKIITNIEKAIGSKPSIRLKLKLIFGKPITGRPLGRVPITETPCDGRLNAELTIIAPITAISAPGTFFEIRLEMKMIRKTTIEIISV